MEVVAEWSGKWPNLCCGSWSLSIDGMDYTYRIPEEKRNSPMNTRKQYSYWHFAPDYDEVWEEFLEGLTLSEWVEENPWVKELPAPPAKVYNAFLIQDWQYGTCGGCI